MNNMSGDYSSCKLAKITTREHCTQQKTKKRMLDGEMLSPRFVI